MSSAILTRDFGKIDDPSSGLLDTVPAASLCHERYFLPWQPSSPPLQNPLPTSFRLGALLDQRFRVIKPFAVVTRREGDAWIAGIEALCEFGVGQTWSDAVAELQRNLMALHDMLRQSEGSLGVDLANVWSTLQSHVEYVEYQPHWR